MTTIQEIETTLTEGQKLCKCIYTEIGKKDNGFPLYKLTYENAPEHYSVIDENQALGIIILKDEDYKEVTP